MAGGIRQFGPRGPYDLVLANILARPLCLMARQLALNLAPGATVILAGLLRNQVRSVLAAHLRCGLRFEAGLEEGPWATLILRQSIGKKGRKALNVRLPRSECLDRSYPSPKGRKGLIALDNADVESMPRTRRPPRAACGPNRSRSGRWRGRSGSACHRQSRSTFYTPAAANVSTRTSATRFDIAEPPVASSLQATRTWSPGTLAPGNWRRNRCLPLSPRWGRDVQCQRA